jgi:HD-GYP domain-containing protein (c-di-GMP phosphodiesterase class II)
MGADIRMAGKKKSRLVKFTDNDDINRLLRDVVSSVKDFTENQLEQIKRLTQIGAALSAERDIDRLLEMIVDEARRFTNADGGTLYIMSDDEKSLHFAIVQNDSLDVRMGGTAGAITWAPVELYNGDDSPNYSNVSSYAALSGEVVNISDVYHAEKFNFEGTRQFDSETGYRSQSMLVIPMRNHENDIIGILQLLNAKDVVTDKTVSFSQESQDLIESLASQAAIALTNNRLIKDLQNLFESFVRTIATAIDEKSPYTGDHGRRVVELTMMIADRINRARDGHFKDVSFNELRIAAWLHDVGKVAIPEYVMDKSTKLTTVNDRIELLKTRFEIVKRDIEIDLLKKKLAQNDYSGTDTPRVNRSRKIKNLEEDFDFLVSVNKADEYMSDESVERVKKIARKKWRMDGHGQALLTDDEIENLIIRKGTLTDNERSIMNNHAAITYRMLSQMPFPKKLKNVPGYASSHHEFLNGEGYPQGLKGDEISLQARILALADVFEALTASDRPYREGNTLSQALKILGFMVKDNQLDPDIYDLFVNEKIYIDYAERELFPSQIDETESQEALKSVN